MRRDRENQFPCESFELGATIWTRSSHLHTGQRRLKAAPTGRTDDCTRRLHRTTCTKPSKESACITGGVRRRHGLKHSGKKGRVRRLSEHFGLEFPQRIPVSQQYRSHIEVGTFPSSSVATFAAAVATAASHACDGTAGRCGPAILIQLSERRRTHDYDRTNEHR